MKLLITTGAGNVIVGGSDIWVNLFIENVWENLNNKDEYILLIDSKRPTEFDEKSIPFNLDYCFYYDDVEFSENLLNSCEEIIFLHAHYHNRPHINKYWKKFKTIFVHAYARDILGVEKKLPELKKLQLQTKVDSTYFDAFLSRFKTIIWIGNNDTMLLQKFPQNVLNVPNFYEFKHELPLIDIKNPKIGFASRNETRKCFHWLHAHQGLALTNRRDVVNLKDTTTFDFTKIKIYQWSPEIHDLFMRKDWGIFHGAYFNEPFGYSIFQAVDYGKLPIINKDWGVEVDYKYRVESKEEFDKCVQTILRDSHDTHFEEWCKLKKYLKVFDNKKVWVERIKSVI